MSRGSFRGGGELVEVSDEKFSVFILLDFSSSGVWYLGLIILFWGVIIIKHHQIKNNLMALFSGSVCKLCGG